MTAGSGDKAEKDLGLETADGDSQPVCRFCWACENVHEPGGELLAPCACDGSMKYLHRRCLQQWQKRCVQVACRSGPHTTTCAVLLQAASTCSICKTRYTVPRSFSLGLNMEWSRVVFTASEAISSIVKGAQLRWLIPCFALAWLVTFTWDAVATLSMESFSAQPEVA